MGVGRYLWNLLREWSRNLSGSDPAIDGVKSLRIDLFLYFKNEIPKDVDYTDDCTNDARWHSQVLNSQSNALFKHWHLPRAAEKDKVDVLFCPDYVLPFFLDSRIKTAVTIHDIIYEAKPNEYSWPSIADKILLKWASKQSAKRADIIFVPSEFTKSEILKYYRINPEKIAVTPLAPDPIFQEVDISGKNKYILFVGSIFNRRFLPQCIQGFTQFARNHPDFRFSIIGKNRTKPFQDIATLVAHANRELGGEAVIWKDYASDEDLVHLYNGAFATLWLSSYEGFGLPVLESMACGTPVITSRGGSLTEVGGDAAIYVEHPENPEKISSALDYLAEDQMHYRKVAERGLSWVKRFSWQKCASQTLRCLL